MAELGSIYEDEGQSGPRGRDLRVKVQVPAYAIGDDEGAWVEVPPTIDVDGEPVARTASPHDRPEAILMRLPEGFPEGGCLRLRGQGETPPGGRAGDLFVEIAIDHEAARPPEALRAPTPTTPTTNAGSTLLLALFAGAAVFYLLFAGT